MVAVEERDYHRREIRNVVALAGLKRTMTTVAKVPLSAAEKITLITLTRIEYFWLRSTIDLSRRKLSGDRQEDLVASSLRVLCLPRR